VSPTTGPAAESVSTAGAGAAVPAGPVLLDADHVPEAGFRALQPNRQSDAGVQTIAGALPAPADGHRVPNLDPQYDGDRDPGHRHLVVDGRAGRLLVGAAPISRRGVRRPGDLRHVPGTHVAAVHSD